MTLRTQETTVTFAHPFRLNALQDLLPAGTYRLVTDEEQIPNVSFLAYRRTATMMHTPAISEHHGVSACLTVNQADLDAALLRDRKKSS